MDTFINALLKFGGYGFVAFVAFFILRGCLKWHQWFTRFRESFKNTLHEVHRAAIRGDWSLAFSLIYGKYDSHLLIMQIFSEDQQQLIINEIYKIQQACQEKNVTDIGNIVCNLAAGFEVFCYQPFRQMYRCPVEFLKTIFGISK